VALIELQKPSAIQELIFDLSTTMIALNAKVHDRTESAKRFDLSSVPITEKTWLPGNVKKIKIGLQCTSELVHDDEEYLELSAECDQMVKAFQDDLNYIYYREHQSLAFLNKYATRSTIDPRPGTYGSTETSSQPYSTARRLANRGSNV
jgi:hypothetical protein